LFYKIVKLHVLVLLRLYHKDLCGLYDFVLLPNCIMVKHRKMESQEIFRSDYNEENEKYAGIKQALGKLLDGSKVKSTEVPENRAKVINLIETLMTEMKKIDQLFASMNPGNFSIKQQTKIATFDVLW